MSHDIPNDPFVTVLENQCNDIMIRTSIDGLVYRVEVYEQMDMIDAIEVNREELHLQPNGEQLFQEAYSNAHSRMRNQYCEAPSPDSHPIDRGEVPEKPEESTPLIKPEKHLNAFHRLYLEMRNRYYRLRGKLPPFQEHRLMYAVSFLLLASPIFFLLGRGALCSRLVVDFFVEPEDRIAYEKRMEPICHKLEKRCFLLSHLSLNQSIDTTPQMCRQWCKAGIIAHNKCELLLSFFPELPPEVPMRPSGNTLREDTNKSVFRSACSCGEEPITLQRGAIADLYCVNHRIFPLRLVLDKVEIDDTPYDEIVQWTTLETERVIPPQKKIRMGLYLENTFYQQFPPGEYNGFVRFNVLAPEMNGTTVTKKITFRVLDQ